MNRTNLSKILAVAAFLLYFSTSATAQISPRVQQMKGDARAVKDASRSSTKAKPAAKAAPKTTTKTSVDNPQDYPTASTSVHRSASEGKTEDIQAELAAHPENLAKKDGEGFLPLHLAAAGGHLESVELLLTSGSEIDAQGTRGETAIYLAAAGGQAQVVSALLAAGANPNLATLELRTPLQRAAMEGSLETVKVLLKGGADATAKDKQGRSALDLAERYNKGPDGNRVVAELLAARK